MKKYIYELDNVEHGYGKFRLLVPELKIVRLEKHALLGIIHGL